MARFYRNGAQFKYIPKVIAVMSAGGVSDTNVKKVFDEGIRVAVANGVPRWKATLRTKYKTVRVKAVHLLKSNRFIWNLLRRQNT